MLDAIESGDQRLDGVVTLGSHWVKNYSQTQEMMALSFGESDLHGIAKAATMGLGVKGLMED